MTRPCLNHPTRPAVYRDGLCAACHARAVRQELGGRLIVRKHCDCGRPSVTTVPVLIAGNEERLPLCAVCEALEMRQAALC